MWGGHSCPPILRNHGGTETQRTRALNMEPTGVVQYHVGPRVNLGAFAFVDLGFGKVFPCA